MLQLVMWLIVINFVLLLVIGLIRQDNPFEVWVMGVVMAGNAVAFVAAAILTHESPLSALNGLVTNALPLVLPACGFALVLFMMTTARPRRRRSRS